MADDISKDENIMDWKMIGIDPREQIKAYYDDENPTIGKKMTYCRLVVHFSTEQLAEFLETTVENLEKYEQDIEEPPLAFLYLYTFYFEIPMEAFVDEFVSMREFMFDYDVFHFAKFCAKYKYIQNCE